MSLDLKLICYLLYSKLIFFTISTISMSWLVLNSFFSLFWPHRHPRSHSNCNLGRIDFLFLYWIKQDPELYQGLNCWPHFLYRYFHSKPIVTLFANYVEASLRYDRTNEAIFTWEYMILCQFPFHSWSFQSDRTWSISAKISYLELRCINYASSEA